MRIAISGAGIAGSTLAFWLLRRGHAVTLIEAAPALRTGGYMIDFWGVGYDVAERMGLLPAIRDAGYDVQDVRFVDRRGRTTGSISAKTMARELGGRFTSLPRGDLAGILFAALEDRAEVLFGVTIAAIDDRGGEARLTLSDGRERAFDLVIGADGLHSQVRALTFGPEATFEVDLGYYAAAFRAYNYRPRDELAYVSHAEPGRQISRSAERRDRTMFLLVFSADRRGGPAPVSAAECKTAIARVFSGDQWEWPAIEQALEAVSEVYFDRVGQIIMPAWTKGRVALVGDAAACVSLLAGEGTGLAMTQAYVLAGELAASPDGHATAFRTYEARLRRFVDGKQRAARSFAGSFAPRTAMGVWVRDHATNLFALPGLPGLLIGPQMRDAFTLPDYQA